MAKSRAQQERSGPRRCANYTRKSTEEGLDRAADQFARGHEFRLPEKMVRDAVMGAVEAKR